MTCQIFSIFTKASRDVSLQVVAANGSTPSARAQPFAQYRRANQRPATKSRNRWVSQVLFSETLPRFREEIITNSIT